MVIQAAAPADYRFAITHDQKLKKQDGLPLMVELVENPDIAAAVGKAKRPGQVLDGLCGGDGAPHGKCRPQAGAQEPGHDRGQ